MLLYHPIRSDQHIRRNCQADLLGCFQVDDKLEFHGLLYGEIRWVGTFKNLSTYVAARRYRSSMFVAYDIRPPASTYSGSLYIAGSRFSAANFTIRERWVLKRPPANTIRAPARLVTAAWKAASKSLEFRTSSDST
jgi:hypothetical protein